MHALPRDTMAVGQLKVIGGLFLRLAGSPEAHRPAACLVGEVKILGTAPRPAARLLVLDRVHGLDAEDATVGGGCGGGGCPYRRRGEGGRLSNAHIVLQGIYRPGVTTP